MRSIAWGMEFERRARGAEPADHGSVNGIVIGLAIAIPFWACVAAVAILLLQEGPLSEAQSAGFMIAAAAEIILLRHAWRTYARGLPWQERLSRAIAARPAKPVMKQTAFLGALVAAYLHYYFWDVQLQIAQLNRLTVFI